MSKDTKSGNELSHPEGVTPEQIAAWKVKYGENKIKVLSLYKPGSLDPFKVVARVPDRKIVSEYFKWVDKNFEKATDILIVNCVLTRADEIKADDELFFTAGTQLAELLPIGRGEIKNL